MPSGGVSHSERLTTLSATVAVAVRYRRGPSPKMRTLQAQTISNCVGEEISVVTFNPPADELQIAPSTA